MTTLPAEHDRMIRSDAADSQAHMVQSNMSNSEGGGK